jgi:hypothetical protein
MALISARTPSEAFAFWQVDPIRAVEQPLRKAIEFLPPDEGQPRQVLNGRLNGDLDQTEGLAPLLVDRQRVPPPVDQGVDKPIEIFDRLDLGERATPESLGDVQRRGRQFGVAILPRNRVRTSW